MIISRETLTEEELETLIEVYDLDPVTLKPSWQ